MTEEEAKRHIADGDIDTLFEFDQLTRERTTGKVFEGFNEHPVFFLPTYKFDPGSSTYDTSEKRRVPSWCDRILWWCPSHTASRVSALSYQGHMNMLLSDHKPVSAKFKVSIKRIDKEKFAQVHTEVRREMDRFENESLPDARVSNLFFDFGDVRYMQAVKQTLVVENVGKFRFVPKGDDDRYCRPWMWVSPPRAILMPGDGVTVTLTVLADNTTTPALNEGTERIEDVLILHLVNGKDYFLSITGKFLPTCFARPLASLVRFPCPVRNFDEHNYTMFTAESQLTVPRELWRMIDFIYLHGMSDPLLFAGEGDADVMAHIRECLDTGEEFDMRILLPEDAKHEENGQSKIEASAQKPADTQTSQAEASEDDIPKETELVVDDADNTGTDALAAQATTETTREDNDSDSEESKSSPGVLAMAETLLLFLASLTEPVVPYKYYDACLQVGLDGTKGDALDVVEQFPSTHLNVMLYITAFLRDVLQCECREEPISTRRARIASEFASVMIRRTRKEIMQLPKARRKREMERAERFFAFFLEPHPIEEESDEGEGWEGELKEEELDLNE